MIRCPAEPADSFGFLFTLSQLLFAKGLGSPGQATGLLVKCWLPFPHPSPSVLQASFAKRKPFRLHGHHKLTSFLSFPTRNSQRGFTQHPEMLKWYRSDMVIACELQFRLNEHYVYEECSSDF